MAYAAPMFRVDSATFGNRLKEYAAAASVSLSEAFKTQGRLLFAELMKRTPPFSGRALGRMLEARGINAGVMDSEIESLSARKVGERRVDKDIRRVIYGMDGPVSERSHQVKMDFGVIEKIQGEQAVRVFADRHGNVYGTDMAHFLPNASMEELAKFHDGARISRGRISRAGSYNRTIGRWKFLNVVVTKTQRLLEYIKFRQKKVGEGKGGWVAGFTALGGRLGSGWVGRHKRAGSASFTGQGTNKLSLTAVNHSSWASGGDVDGIIAKSMQFRDVAMCKDIERRLKYKW